MGGSAWMIRDLRKRVSARDMELQRRAYLYIARNTTLPTQVRYRAQLGLNALNGGEGRMTAVRNRCTETAYGHGVMGKKFGLCGFQFRLKALNGEIPGMNKASW